MANINPEKPVPTPEDVSAELRTLYQRQNNMTAESKAIDEEQRALAREDASVRRDEDRKHQIDALIRGSSYEPPAATREKMASLAKRRDLLNEAQREIAELIRQERIKASQLVVAEFKPEQAALAKEFFQHLAKAIAVHSRFGKMKRRLECAGVDTGGLPDFGLSLLGHPNSRTDHAAYALRYGLRFNHIKKADVPEGYLE
ncbi:hypothetical protein [Mesorhizobium escarrei]|uniref:Exonuclease SbcC n=1 Tax=Mesorhizobium escarrei TaxID=666018 RepID=A0ABM9EJ33_9HYPH|nr:hypothetical protein [Mesorhizobium escarrei]CAH2409373.1 Exonuclease SbcC [Mesorhizobium escarrei]